MGDGHPGIIFGNARAPVSDSGHLPISRNLPSRWKRLSSEGRAIPLQTSNPELFLASSSISKLWTVDACFRFSKIRPSESNGAVSTLGVSELSADRLADVSLCQLMNREQTRPILQVCG